MTTGKDSNYDKLSMLDCLSTLEIDKYIRKKLKVYLRGEEFACLPALAASPPSLLEASPSA